MSRFEKEEDIAKVYPKPKWAIQQLVRSSGLIENVCCHGIGHPHPKSVEELEKAGHEGYGIHGCDGCCHDASLPKKAISTAKIEEEESPPLKEEELKPIWEKLATAAKREFMSCVRDHKKGDTSVSFMTISHFLTKGGIVFTEEESEEILLASNK